MKLQRTLFVIGITSLGAPASGAIITFEDLVIDHLNTAGPQVEGDFTYEATIGDAWELISEFGNPPSSLTTFFNGEPALVGDTVEIALTGGGLFSFTSVDFSTISDSESDQVTITGFVSNVPVGTLVLNTSTTTFQTVASGFTSDIDLLRVEVTFAGSNALLLDNFNVTPIPAPASLALLAGLGGLTVGRRRRVHVHTAA